MNMNQMFVGCKSFYQDLTPWSLCITVETQLNNIFDTPLYENMDLFDTPLQTKKSIPLLSPIRSEPTQLYISLHGGLLSSPTNPQKLQIYIAPTQLVRTISAQRGNCNYVTPSKQMFILNQLMTLPYSDAISNITSTCIHGHPDIACTPFAMNSHEITSNVYAPSLPSHCYQTSTTHQGDYYIEKIWSHDSNINDKYGHMIMFIHGITIQLPYTPQFVINCEQQNIFMYVPKRHLLDTTTHAMQPWLSTFTSDTEPTPDIGVFNPRTNTITYKKGCNLMQCPYFYYYIKYINKNQTQGVEVEFIKHQCIRIDKIPFDSSFAFPIKKDDYFELRSVISTISASQLYGYLQNSSRIELIDESCDAFEAAHLPENMTRALKAIPPDLTETLATTLWNRTLIPSLRPLGSIRGGQSYYAYQTKQIKQIKGMKRIKGTKRIKRIKQMKRIKGTKRISRHRMKKGRAGVDKGYGI